MTFRTIKLTFFLMTRIQNPVKTGKLRLEEPVKGRERKDKRMGDFWVIVVH